MTEKWLITGAQGFIGRYFTAAVLRSGVCSRVAGVGRSERLTDRFCHSISGPDGFAPAPLPADIRAAFDNEQYSYLKADILDTAAMTSLFCELRPDVIVHLASGLRGDARGMLFETNVEGTARLLEAAGTIENYRPMVLLGSSGGVYGNVSSDQLPLKESMPCDPVDEYSVSKLAAEQLARSLARRFGFRLKIARIFNVIGPGQDERHAAGRIAAELKRVQTGEQECLRIGSLTPTRDFMDVRDAAAALCKLAADDLPDGIYNVGSGVETSVEQLLAAFLGASRLQVRIEHAEPRRFDIPRHFADIGRLRNLGYRPCCSLMSSVDSVWNYYNESWVRPRLV